MGAMALPSVKASTDTSGPSRNSSMTTRSPLLPKAWSHMVCLDRFLGLPRAFADEHALAQRQPVALTTSGAGVLRT